MIKKNIFRPLPSTNRNNVALGVSETGVEEEEQEPDPSWVHIRGIYEIFLQLIRKNYDKSIRIAQPPDERNKLDPKWKGLCKLAEKANTNFVEPVLPFNDGYVLSDYNSVYKNIYNKEKYLND